MGVAIVGALVAAGATAYSAYNASQGPDDPNAVFGKKPKVAPYTPIDLSEEQKKAAASNLENLPSITEILSRMDPGFSDLIKSGLATSQSLVNGQIPQDIQDEILRGDAFQSLMGGFGGTQMGRNLTARDFGRTSLDLFSTGTNAAQKWTSIANDAYKPYMITTQDETSAAAANNAGQQATQQYQYNVDAAPNPVAAGQYNLQLAQNQQMQQSLSQFGSIMSGLGRSNLGGTLQSSYANWNGAAPYATNAGSFGVPRAQLVSVYNGATGQYELVPGG